VVRASTITISVEGCGENSHRLVSLDNTYCLFLVCTHMYTEYDENENRVFASIFKSLYCATANTTKTQTGVPVCLVLH